MSDSFFTCVLMENYAYSVPFVGLKGDFVSSSILLTQLPILTSQQINWAQRLLVREHALRFERASEQIILTVSVSIA